MRMQKEGKVVNTFRLFFDLQGYSLKEIPEAFLFDHCVKFYLTEKNNEDMEGFNDVWANILNDDLLNAKDLMNVQVLEQHSEIWRLGVNLESHIMDNSMEHFIPTLTNNEDSSNILDKMSESKITIILPSNLEESDL